jgi:hypothetical protein
MSALKQLSNIKLAIVVVAGILFISNCNLHPTNPPTLPPSNMVFAFKYLPTLQFDGTDWFDTGEKNFPMIYTFNTTQDGNGDGIIDTDDAVENLVNFSIGDSIYGTGRTGLPNRGPNDQRLAVYFHLSYVDSFTVYEYWLYYADNDWTINEHEQDWEYYFVYEMDGQPEYIKLNNHTFFTTYDWASFPKDNGHPIIDVGGGGHAMLPGGNEDGVLVRWNGIISENDGHLDHGANDTIPWRLFSNDSLVLNTWPYIMQPDTFNYGDPIYFLFTSTDEYGDQRPAPWKRDVWDSPPLP